jgi:Tfp pilus assembly protein PilO
MRERYLIFILVMILVSVAFFLIAANSISKNVAQIDSYDKKIKVNLEKLNSATIMEAQLSQFTEIINNSLTKDTKYPVDELNSFQKEIEALRDQNQMRLLKISDSNKFTEAGMIENTYNLELEGTFQQMGQFISALEAMNNIIKIQVLDISPNQTSSKGSVTDPNAPNKYRITIEMSIFKVKKEA